MEERQVSVNDSSQSLWHERAEELARRREMALGMGGVEKIARHHANGRLTVRERIDLLLDARTFREVGRLSGTPT
jgi:acetyl-CoA carboxylase carboxyltransferase component